MDSTAAMRNGGLSFPTLPKVVDDYPSVTNPGQVDTGRDGLGDACDDEDENDDIINKVALTNGLVNEAAVITIVTCILEED